MQFFATDWLTDPQVSICDPATRGILMDWLCNMHLLDRSGQITGTREQLARLGRCTAVQVEAALQDLNTTKAADVTLRNDVVTVVNRRMKREHLSRKNGVKRVARHRSNVACNAYVTPHSQNHKSESESESESEGGGEPPAREALPELPTIEQAIAQTMTAAIPEDFTRYVFDDWSSRQGKDAGGVLVKFLPYVVKRWTREQVEWKAKTHKGRKDSPKLPASSGPLLRAVQSYCAEKWGDDPRHVNWAISFHRFWSDPKRDWKRQGRPIDWMPEITKQVAKWREGGTA